MVATELLKLAIETDGERKARLKKMVATTQLRLAPEQRTKEELDWNICQITQSINITEQKFISDCRYRVIKSSSLVPVLFREVFSHPYISFFHLLVNGFSVTCIPNNLYLILIVAF